MRILIPVDGSLSSKRVIDFLGERKSFLGPDAQIELVTVLPEVPEGFAKGFGIMAVETLYNEQAQQVLEQLEPDIASTGLKMDFKHVAGLPGVMIAQEAEDFQADLIIMGNRGLSGFKRLFLGSVSTGVLEHTTKPVLLMRETPLTREPNMRVVIATDGSDYGLKAAQFVCTHPNIFGHAPRISVVHVTPDYLHFISSHYSEYVHPMVDIDKFQAENNKLFRQAVDPILDLFGQHDIACEAVQLEGDAADAIVEFTKDHADVIIMGSHGWGNFKATVLGSVAMRVGAKTQTPLLIIRQ